MVLFSSVRMASRAINNVLTKLKVDKFKIYGLILWQFPLNLRKELVIPLKNQKLCLNE